MSRFSRISRPLCPRESRVQSTLLPSTSLLLATPGVVDLPNLLLITPRVDLVFTVKSHRGSLGLHAQPRNAISVFTSYHTVSLRLPLLSCNVAYHIQGTLARLPGKSIPRFSLGCLEAAWSGSCESSHPVVVRPLPCGAERLIYPLSDTIVTKPQGAKASETKPLARFTQGACALHVFSFSQSVVWGDCGETPHLDHYPGPNTPGSVEVGECEIEEMGGGGRGRRDWEVGASFMFVVLGLYTQAT